MINIHHSDKKQVIPKSAAFLINYLQLYHNITQKTLLLLSGGSAVEIYKPLADFIGKSDLDWRFLTVAKVDERFFGTFNIKHLTFNKQEINAYQIEKTGLWEVCSKKKIPYYTISQEGSLESSTDKYNITLEKLFKENIYKMAVLGIGVDGHTAGLLPGYRKVWDTANLVTGYQNSGSFPRRISITPKAIKMLDRAIVVASGEKKREAVKHLTLNIKQITNNKEQRINNKDLDEFPVIILHKIPQVDLFTD